MLRTARFLLPVICCFSLTACEEGWTEEIETDFLSKCKAEARGMYTSDAQVAAYCACNLDVMKKHFPSSHAMNERRYKDADDSARVHRELEDCSVKARQ